MSSTVFKEFIIRDATADDCQELRKLIQELADFEKMPNGPKISADELIKDGFESGSAPFFRCCVAERQSNPGVLLGFVLYYNGYSTWEGRCLFVEDLYVNEQCRGTGLGRALMKKVSQIAVAMGCAKINFYVLRWNPAVDFYRRIGAVNVTESEQWHFFRLPGDAMRALAAES